MEDKIKLGIKDLFKIIKNRIWVVIIITLAITAASVSFSAFFASPSYEAKASVLVRMKDSKNISDQEVALYSLVYQTYNNIASTYQVAQIAAEKLGSSTAPNELLSRTTVTANSGTMIIDISVKDNSAQKAYNEAKAYSEAFIERAGQLKISGGDVEIVDGPQLPKSPANINTKHSLIKGFVLGFLISVLAAFALEFKNLAKAA